MPSVDEFQEVECKFLDVEVSALTARLNALGAKKLFTELFRRSVFDFPGWPLDTKGACLRVRDEGSRVTASYKQRLGVKTEGNDDGMREVEIVVDDFDHACELFRSLGMESKFYEENRRTQYLLDGVEVCIDEWPLIPPYVELEGTSWEALETLAQKLGFDWEERKIYSTNQIYDQYGFKEQDYKILTFDKQVRR